MFKRDNGVYSFTVSAAEVCREREGVDWESGCNICICMYTLRICV